MSDIFEIAKSGILANQRALDITGQNISNAANPEFSRRRVEFSEQGFSENTTFTGLGVKVEDITRFRSDIIDERTRAKQSDLGNFNEQTRIFKQLESVLSTDTQADLDARLNNLFDSFIQLGSNPESDSLRQNVVREAQNLTNSFKSISSSIDAVQEETADKTSSIVGRINNLLREIASLNSNITSGESEGRESDFKSLDQRTAKLEELSKLIDVSITEDENRSLTVRVGSIVVVQDDQSKTLTPEVDLANNQARVRVDGSKVLRDIGGELGANIKMTRETIPDIKENLNTLAETVVQEVNAIHTSGFGLNNATGISFFDPANTTATTISVNALVASNTDNIAASDAPNSPGNSDNVVELANLRDSSNIINNQSITEFAVGLITSVGSEINNLETASSSAQSALDLLEQQQQSISGVNIDEELANMIKFQNSFQASARVLNTAQTMFDSLLTIV